MSCLFPSILINNLKKEDSEQNALNPLKSFFTS